MLNFERSGENVYFAMRGFSGSINPDLTLIVLDLGAVHSELVSTPHDRLLQTLSILDPFTIEQNGESINVAVQRVFFKDHDLLFHD